MSHLRFCRASKSHRIEQRSIPRTSRATVRLAMMQRVICPVTLATLRRDPLSRVKVARDCRRCDIGLTDTSMLLTTAVESNEAVTSAITELQASVNKQLGAVKRD